MAPPNLQLTQEQMTLLEDIATGAYHTLKNVLLQRNNSAKYQIKTPSQIEDRVMSELTQLGVVAGLPNGKLGLTGIGTKIWRAELELRKAAAKECGP